MQESQQLFFGLRLVSEEFQHPAIQTKIDQSLSRFSYQIKVCWQKGRKDSIQTIIQTSRRLDYFFMKWLRTLKSFQIFKTEIKKSKTYSGWCPFQGQSSGTTLIQIQSGRTVPLKVVWISVQIEECNSNIYRTPRERVQSHKKSTFLLVRSCPHF
jgi:hypothetical protein